MTVQILRGVNVTSVRKIQNWLNAAKVALDQASNHIASVMSPDGVIGGSYTFTPGAAVTLAVSGWVKVLLNGIEQTFELAATVALEDLGDISQNNFGAWRIEVDRTGAMTMKSAPTVGGYSTAEKALLALAGLAPTANTVTIGYMTMVKTGSAFNIGTDNLTVATGTAVVYYERSARKRISGLTLARGAASILTPGAATVNSGTVDAQVNGVRKTQIAAAGTQALTDADTIPTLKYGAVLIMTNLAGTGIVSLNALGVPGVGAMSYTSKALAKAAIDLVVDRLPSMFVPVALIEVKNLSGGTFTFKSTFWDATSITSTITDAGVAGWDRTVPTGFNSHQVNKPAVPAAQDTFVGP